MAVVLATYGSRGDVGSMVGLAMGLRALGAELQAFAPPDRAPAGRCDALVASGVEPEGVWR